MLIEINLFFSFLSEGSLVKMNTALLLFALLAIGGSFAAPSGVDEWWGGGGAAATAFDSDETPVRYDGAQLWRVNLENEKVRRVLERFSSDDDDGE